MTVPEEERNEQQPQIVQVISGNTGKLIGALIAGLIAGYFIFGTRATISIDGEGGAFLMVGLFVAAYVVYREFNKPKQHEIYTMMEELREFIPQYFGDRSIYSNTSADNMIDHPADWPTTNYFIIHFRDTQANLLYGRAEGVLAKLPRGPWKRVLKGLEETEISKRIAGEAAKYFSKERLLDKTADYMGY